MKTIRLTDAQYEILKALLDLDHTDEHLNILCDAGSQEHNRQVEAGIRESIADPDEADEAIFELGQQLHEGMYGAILTAQDE